ncbi:PQQ-binding-like beta-propeller repeat protein [Paenibacillus sonchi]|uniref:PQQ-binding-like beta-propeller repeat protein n=1 Tax=Paenibacillus sonchi TaxID=373687 RepID=A0A974PAK9_9BACL|nr:PQQ-binding-like beta-propeller repeat protein [Paenibacillus sonchi]QQZ59946.1 PQQ-binding-like beta-propeller repeat protein [Paenibacillus sonchi]
MPQVKSIKPILSAFLSLSLLSSGIGLSLQAIHTGTAHAASAGSTAAKVSKDSLLPLKWQVATDGMGMYDTTQPVMNGILYFSAKNTLYAKNIASGQIRWSYKTGEHPQIVTNNSVFFIDNNEQLVKVSASTGKLLWKVKVSERPMEIGGQAQLMNGKVYFANESGGVAAYHPATGKKLWENKKIPMYVGTLHGEYKGVLVVSSTVDNIRRQFFGLDPATGKQLWRTEGICSMVAYQDGHFVLREQAKAEYENGKAPVPGHLLTLVSMDPATGKVTNKENYQALDDISRQGNFFTSIQKPYVYSVDGNLDKDEYILTRFTRGANAGTAPKSYESFGKWLAGPADGMAFFQKGTQITGVHLADDSVVTFDNPASKVEHLERVGKAVFAIYENGYISINHSDTGALLGMIKSGASTPYFGNISIVNGTALIPTEHNLLAVALPKEWK